MRASLVLLVSLAVLLSLFLPAIEAAAARRRGKAGRRGGVAFRGRQQGRRGRARVQARRGRQDADVAADDANESLLDDCVLRLRRSRPNASKEYIKMLSGTQLALAGTDSKNE